VVILHEEIILVFLFSLLRSSSAAATCVRDVVLNQENWKTGRDGGGA